jgi:YbbR domain-containing protein
MAGLRGLFLDHLPQKAIAAALAITLVVFVREDKVSSVTTTVRVRVGRPDDRVLVSPMVDKVTVVIEGKYGALRRLDTDQLPPLDLNLSGNEGDQVSFEPEMVKLPAGLSVRSVRPPAMVVRFEPLLQKRVPVNVVTTGEPALGFRITQLRVDPPEVQIEGAASVVEALTRVETLPVELAGRSQSATVEVALRAAPAFVTWMGPVKYRVALGIEERQGTRVLDDRPVILRGAEATGAIYELSPGEVDITLSGPARLLDALELDRVVAYVDAPDLGKSKRVLFTRVVGVEFPPGISLTEVKPSKVTLARTASRVRPESAESAPR